MMTIATTMRLSAPPWLDGARTRAVRMGRAFDGRTRRERLILIGAGVAVVWMLADNLWLTPAFKRWSDAQARRVNAALVLQHLNDEIAQRGVDARSAAQQRLRDLVQSRARVDQGNAALHGFGAVLVSAPDMVPMLDRLLAQVGGLRLRSMQSLGRTEVGGAGGAPGAPATPLAHPAGAAKPASPANPTNTAAALYRHGVELTIEGSYADVLAYLLAIEAMPQRVLWGGMQLRVEQHPQVIVDLRLYTLSQDRNWLEL